MATFAIGIDHIAWLQPDCDSSLAYEGIELEKDPRKVIRERPKA